MRFFWLLFIVLFIACSTEKQAEEMDVSQPSLQDEEVVYNADGVDLHGYLVYDENLEGKRPGVLVVHEWWGHNDYARTRAEMLAELGYTALAVDMYGEGKQADHPDEAGQFAQQAMENLNRSEARFMAAMDFLKDHRTTDSSKIAAIGYCFGGSVVLHMARTGTDLDGVVSFHGGLQSMYQPEPGEVKAEILVLHGAEDKMATQEQIENFKKEMEQANADYQFISYPGAMHSFTNPAADSLGKKFDLPIAYHKEVDQKSWEEMKQFFNRIFME